MLPTDYIYPLEPKVIFDDEPIDITAFMEFLKGDCRAFVVQKGDKRTILFDREEEIEGQNLLKDYINNCPNLLLDNNYDILTIYMFPKNGYKIVATLDRDHYNFSVWASNSFVRYLDKWDNQPELPEESWCVLI